MRRLIILLLLLVLTVTACTFGFQTMTQAGTETPNPTSAPTVEAGVPGPAQGLEGPNINYNGIRFTLDPALGSRLYIYNDILTIDGKSAHSFRFSMTPEEYCRTWCLTVYPVVEFQQAFGDFVFPPAGYRGGAAVVFKAQEKPLAFQNVAGTRSLETFGQDHYGVSNESLKYVFRGYSADKQYGIYVQVPIRTSFLPDMAPTMTTSSDPIQDILQYNQQATQSINALVPVDFTPSLDSLDALVTSIRIGKP